MTTVLGGGISGLSAAYYLLKRSPNPVTLLEATDRIGGWIRTDTTHQKDGYIFEAGPRTIRTAGPAAYNTLQLIEELGMENKLNPIDKSHVAAKNRMIYANNQLCPLPSSIGGAFKTLPPFSKPLAMAALTDLFTGRSKQKLEDESIFDFCSRRFGNEIATYAISPMICGICAGDAKEISVKFLMKSLFEKEQKYGGVLKGMWMGRNDIPKEVKRKKSKLENRAHDERWSIFSLDGGLETLPQTLGATLKTYTRFDMKVNSRCSKLEFHKDKIEMTINGRQELSNFLVSGIPSNQLATMVVGQHPYLASELSKIPLVDVVVINLRYNAPNILNEKAFGFLVPPVENLPILGVIFDSCCFDMKGNTVLTVMMGGKWFKERFGARPAKDVLWNIAVEHVNKILKISVPPTTSKVNILKNCIPQYVVGHHKRVENIRNYISEKGLPLAICGASYDGVGVNDAILSARNVVDSLYFT